MTVGKINKVQKQTENRLNLAAKLFRN